VTGCLGLNVGMGEILETGVWTLDCAHTEIVEIVGGENVDSVKEESCVEDIERREREGSIGGPAFSGCI